MPTESSFSLERFLELIDRDIELFESLLRVFSGDWPEVIASIKSANEKGDAGEVQKAGHRLKGNLKNFYADQLATLAFEIEEAGRSSDLAPVPSLVSSLESKIKQLESELTQALATLKSDQP